MQAPHVLGIRNQKFRPVHSQRLETWLGRDEVEHISGAMLGHNGGPRWYGPEIAVSNVPGRVFATADGDFVGDLKGGQAACAVQYFVDRLKHAYKKWERRQHRQFGAFSSLGDLIAEATGGKRQEFPFVKTGTTGVVGVSNTLWGVGAMPSAGAVASAAPGGRAPTKATAGALPFANPTGGDTQHFVSGFPLATVINTLLLYDRIFDVVKAASSSATEAVTGVPTRYQSTTQGAADYIGGNFLFVEQFSALAATAHNWTACLYTDDAGNASQTLPSLASPGTALINRLDHAGWFAPLAVGDTGIKELDQMQCSAGTITGNANFVIGHPIAWMPCPIANVVCIMDGINTAFNLARIFDDACLAFLEVYKPTTTATQYTGTFTTVSG